MEKIKRDFSGSSATKPGRYSLIPQKNPSILRKKTIKPARFLKKPFKN
jgi:hypothetical protein